MRARRALEVALTILLLAFLVGIGLLRLVRGCSGMFAP